MIILESDQYHPTDRVITILFADRLEAPSVRHFYSVHRDQMSLWIRRREADGRFHHYAIPFSPFAIVIAVGILVGFFLPLILAIRGLVIRNADQTVFIIAASLAIGVAMFVVAKLSVVRSIGLISFGSAKMTRSMRLMYVGGYAAMGFAAALAIFLLAST